MSDGGASNKIKGDFQHWFEAWRNCTQNVLSQVSGKPVVFETILEPLAASDSDQCFTVVAAGSVQGEMSLRLSQNAAVRLARKFLGETEASTAEGGDPKNTEALSNDDREALEEMLRQVAGLAATTAGSELGGRSTVAGFEYGSTLGPNLGRAGQYSNEGRSRDRDRHRDPH